MATTTCITRDSCAGCGQLLPAPFLDLGVTPLADRFPAPGDEEEWFPLRVSACNSCHLVQLIDLVDDAALFGEDYGFTTGSSPALVSYYADVARELMFTYPHHAERGVLDIGCNDGTLLGQFSGYPLCGVDPSVALRAPGFNGLAFSRQFSKATAEEIGSVFEPGLILAFNVAAHMANPHEFFGGLRILMSPETVALVEFQYLGDLLNGCQWDHVYHEHRFFYSLQAFATLAAQHGLAITNVARTVQQGGSLRVTLERMPAEHAIQGFWEPAGPALAGNDIYHGFQSRVDYSVTVLRDLVNRETERGRIIAGFGATAKSCTLLNYARIGPKQVRWVEDLTQWKAGRFVPGRMIPIVHPADRPEPPDTYLMLGWNYLGRGMRMAQATWPRADFRFIVPGGVPTLI